MKPPRSKAPKKKDGFEPPRRKRKGPPRGGMGSASRTSKADRKLREDLVAQVSLEAYGAIRHEGRLSDRALEFVLRHKKHLYSNERRAVAERVYALLRRQLTVDWLFDRIAPNHGKMAPAKQDLMRLSISRVLHGEDVEKVGKDHGLGGGDVEFLRKLPEAAEALEALPRKEKFSIAASLPPFLAERFLREFGDEAEAAAEAMNERAPLAVRANTLKTDRDKLLNLLGEEGVRSRTASLSSLGVVLDTRMNAFSLTTFREGFFEIQDEGSQLLGQLVDPMPTKCVDACAGAGGKTLQLAAAMKNRGELFAFDIDERRMEDLKKRARRAGVHNVRVRVIPAGGPEADTAIADLLGRADRVLVDAPCSGSGTYRRKPDARYRITEAMLQEHVERQKTLLDRFSQMVKPGGRIIYGTCSIFREENEEVIEHFLKTHPGYSVRDAALELPEKVGPKVTRDGFLRLFPHKHGTDGFFGAILVKQKA